MNKNINFFNQMLDECKLFDINISLVKNFLSSYFIKDYMDDSFFLKSIDFSRLNFEKFFFDYSFDYKKYIDFDIASDSQVIVFLNGNLLFVKNLDYGVFLNSFVKNDSEFLLKKFIENDDFLLKNLNFFYILNTLFYKFFNYICVSDKSVITKPLYILNFFNEFYSNSLFSPRTFLKVSKNVSINILEFYLNLSKNSFVNSNTFLYVDSNSKVNFNLINDSSGYVSHFFYSKLSSYSKLLYNSHSFGINFFKENCYFALLDSFSELYFKGGNFLKKNSYNDFLIKVFHLTSNTFSRVLFKSITAENSNCSFYGLIDVENNIFGIDAGLNCSGLLLSESSCMKMLPELSIRSNDVKCFHGAALGFLDDNIIFYIMSRGFSFDDCVSLLVNSFLLELIDVDNFFLKNFIYCLFKKYYVF
jgi:Fe-S cluster assembly protein SufD